jgi:hypothetical protein
MKLGPYEFNPNSIWRTKTESTKARPVANFGVTGVTRELDLAADGHPAEQVVLQLATATREGEVRLSPVELSDSRAVQKAIASQVGAAFPTAARAQEDLRAALQLLVAEQSHSAGETLVASRAGFVRLPGGAWAHVTIGSCEPVRFVGAESDVIARFPSDEATAKDVRVFFGGPAGVKAPLARAARIVTVTPLLDRRVGGGRSAVSHFQGPTGVGKTPLQRKIANAWGVSVQTWQATAKALHALHERASDQPLVVDEFKRDFVADAAGAELFHLVADGHERRALRPDQTEAPSRKARATLISAGEDFVDGHASVEGRVVVIPVHRGDIDGAILAADDAWSDAAARLLGAFVRELAVDFDHALNVVSTSQQFLRRELGTREGRHKSEHPRSLENVARLVAIYDAFLDFAATLDPEFDRKAELVAARECGHELLRHAAGRVMEADVAERFLEDLRAGLVAGQVAISGLGSGDGARGAHPDNVGWATEREVCLLLRPAHHALGWGDRRLPAREHTERQVSRALAEGGYLAVTDTAQFTVKRLPPGRGAPVRVLVLRRELFET